MGLQTANRNPASKNIWPADQSRITVPIIVHCFFKTQNDLKYALILFKKSSYWHLAIWSPINQCWKMNKISTARRTQKKLSPVTHLLTTQLWNKICEIEISSIIAGLSPFGNSEKPVPSFYPFFYKNLQKSSFYYRNLYAKFSLMNVPLNNQQKEDIIKKTWNNFGLSQKSLRYLNKLRCVTQGYYTILGNYCNCSWQPMRNKLLKSLKTADQ